MKFSDYFRFCYRGLVQRKTRSYLTILGIVIGIMAIVGLISIGVGMQVYMNEQIGKMGTNKIILMPMPPGRFRPAVAPHCHSRWSQARSDRQPFRHCPGAGSRDRGG